MKPPSKLHSLLHVASIALLAASSAQAQIVWDDSESNLWNNADNWVGGVAPVSGNSLTFSGTDEQRRNREKDPFVGKNPSA
jgi:hypothetical protein